MEDLASPSAEERRLGVRTQLLAVVTVILVGWALKATSSVTLPLAFGLFVACLLWPLMRRLSKVMPRGLAALLTTVVFAAGVGAFGWGLYELGDLVEDRLTESPARLDSLVGSVRDMLAGIGISADGGDQSWVLRGGKVGFEIVGGAFLVLAFASLSLYEAHETGQKVTRATSRRRRAAKILGVTDRVSTQFVRYFWVRTMVGAITGVGCALGAWLIGLDLWWLWGLINFLLNYIPTLGSIIGVVPPALYALVQFEGDWGMAAAAIGVVGGVQLVMGNWIDPLVQGRALTLSPLVVLFSVVFWGWVWGVAGALIGVPLTVLIVLMARESAHTRWIAVMLAGLEEVQREEDSAPQSYTAATGSSELRETNA